MANDPWLVLRSQLDDGSSAGASPDIILGGPKPDPNYAKQYDTAFNQTGNFSASNFVYVRAKNAGTDLAVGSVELYAVHLGDLPNQGRWTPLHTSDGRSSTNIWAAAGNVGVNGTPLIWEPDGPPPDDAPWCLIAEITGDDYPMMKVPGTVTDRQSFDTWIATQTRLAYMVVKAPEVVTPPAPAFGWEHVVDLKNQAETTLAASLTCTSGAVGGFLSYVFDQNDSSGQSIGVGKTRFQIGNSYSQTRKVPAGFSSKVSVTYTPAADEDGQAALVFQVATESDDGDGGDLDTPTQTVVATYQLSFGQTQSKT